ncbi:NAD-dependent deacetylase [Xylanimonas oleitrophica]|uniref:protein acetyllysine N-acetyltransferase n=1 Tax=Xylanimonas oleitrophica TaxID=2607479 RepID=A0A2W5WTJ8_9MICO|nr:Sir2 family NAD-dependent protein deacetylase [Xylanimonas oleitrophica]PZR54192.1 NAD-dependent deacetylase [Xylanimonas oleitrophica]
MNVTVLTGAGISTGSGIPDFRGPQGVWTRRPEQARLLEIDAYRADAAVREAGWREWAGHPAWRAEPTAAHRALVSLEEAGVLGTVLTQNFEGLHQAAGHSPDKVVELHGTLRTTSCMGCGWQRETAAVLERLATEPDPRCPECGGILKPDIVYFGELLHADALSRSTEAASQCDLMIAIGTSLTVYPVANLPMLALEAGADLVVVNAQPTPYDRLATEVLREPIDEAVPALVGELLAT